MNSGSDQILSQSPFLSFLSLWLLEIGISIAMQRTLILGSLCTRALMWTQDTLLVLISTTRWRHGYLQTAPAASSTSNKLLLANYCLQNSETAWNYYLAITTQQICERISIYNNNNNGIFYTLKWPTVELAHRPQFSSSADSPLVPASPAERVAPPGVPATNRWSLTLR